MATATKDTGEARLRWYADAPVCPECNEHRVSVGQATIGFFGLSVTYFDRCDECLPTEVADYSRQVRANLLGTAADTCEKCGSNPTPHRDETVLGGMALCQSCAESLVETEGLWEFQEPQS